MKKKIEKTGGKSAGKTAAAPKAKKPSATSKTDAAKKKAAPAKAARSAAKKKTPTAKKKTAAVKARPAAVKAKAAPVKAPAKKVATKKVKEATPEVSTDSQVAQPILDPIGDVSDGEARSSMAPDADGESTAMMEAYRDDTEDEAEDDEDDLEDEEVPEDEEEQEKAPRPPAKLERLQKILSQAGVASRRHAEELIEQGRVMVNGKVVDKLGSKADAGRDHIRVDGKLLHGAERHRYFVLNKPKGYVTTVSDPEGRSTVMEFFAGMSERLYPVGRLDYQSEGLLLMTNDGALANQLTKAASGVEKTYLVKVAGQPTEQELETLRGGVAIERGKPGSPKVRTAPAAVRQVRQGDNPWYEVVLIEGRNRELRKMFSAIGHFVEKIRRVGYGPLILDQEPGKFRELDADELKALKLTAEGKLKPKRTKTLLISEEVRPSSDRYDRPPAREGRGPEGRTFERRDDRRGPPMGGRTSTGRPPARNFEGRSGGNFVRSGRPPFARPQGERPANQGDRGQRPSGPPRFDRPQGERSGAGPGAGFGGRPPRFDRPGFTSRPRDEGAPRFEGRKTFQPRPPFREDSNRPHYQRNEGGGKRFDRPSRPPFDRGAGPRPDHPAGQRFDKAAGARFDRPSAPRSSGPRFDKGAGVPRFDRPSRPSFDRGAGSRPDRPSRPPFDRGAGPHSDRPRPDRGQGRGFDRGPQKSFGKPPGAGFASKPGGRFDRAPGKSFDRRPAGNFGKGPARDFGRGPSNRPEGSTSEFRGPGSPRSGGPGGPPAFGGRPSSGKPSGDGRPGGFVKSGYRPGGAKRSGTRPGVSKSSLKQRPGGKKRG